MSETLTLTGGATGQTYGSFAGATTYIAGMFGDQYETWRDLEPDDQKRTLIAATRFLDRQVWTEAVDTFALRDAVVVDGASLFQNACYELAALVADEPTVIAVTDQGSNIQAVDAGGAGVTYFNPTSSRQGTAPRLPQILMDLIGGYLSSSSTGVFGGSGASGSCENPFDERNDFKRWDPF